MSSLRAFSRQSVTIYIVASSAFATQAMMAPLVPLLGLELNATPTTIGGLVSMGFLLPLILALPVGSLMNRCNKKTLIMLGTLGMVLSPLPLVLFPTLPVLAAAQLFLGLSHLVIVVTAQALVASLADGQQREQNFAWYTTFVSGGQLFGPILAGALLDYTEFSWAFGCAALVGLVGLGSAIHLPTVSVNARSGSAVSQSPPGSTLLIATPGVQIALLVSSSVLLALSAYQAFVPTYLSELRFSATAIGGLLSLRALASMLVRPFTARFVAALRGRLLSMGISLSFVAVGLALTGTTSTAAALIVLATLIGIGSGFAQPVSMATIADHVPAQRWGVALGLRVMSNRAAQFVGPLVLGFVAQQLGFAAMFLAGGGLVFVATGFLYLLRSRFSTAEISYRTH